MTAMIAPRHPHLNDRPVLLGDRVRLRIAAPGGEALTVVAMKYSDVDDTVWIDLHDRVYTVSCTVEEIEAVEPVLSGIEQYQVESR